MNALWRMARKLLVALALAPMALASDSREVSINLLYDLDSETFVYCASLGRAGNAGGAGAVSQGTSRGDDYQAPFKIKTTGSSTTTVSNTASQGAFANINVGDILVVIQAGRRLERVVLTNADDDTVVVDEAWDLSDGTHFYWREVLCDDGTSQKTAIPVADMDHFTLLAQAAQSDAASVDVNFECRFQNGPWLIVETKNITAYGNGTANYLRRDFFNENFEACRVGLKLTTDTSDAGAAIERINVWLKGRGVVR